MKEEICPRCGKEFTYSEDEIDELSRNVYDPETKEIVS